MLTVISPAKTLDFDSPLPTRRHTQPAFLDHSNALIKELRELDPEGIAALMKVSPKIAELNFQRYLDFDTPFTPDNARPAVFAFKGDVYSGLKVEDFDAEDLRFAQSHLRILSGLYGLLRPLDLIQPYRLEMGTRLDNARGKDLYAFWGTRLSEAVNAELRKQGDEVLVNLASQEYFKALDRKALDARVVTPVFKDWKNGVYKIISFYAKKARGLMSAWLVRERIEQVEDLEAFTIDGYRFAPELSEPDAPVFIRRQAA